MNGPWNAEPGHDWEVLSEDERRRRARVAISVLSHRDPPTGADLLCAIRALDGWDLDMLAAGETR